MKNFDVNNLKLYAKFRNHEDVLKFETILSEMGNDINEANFESIISVLDDETEYEEVMFGVVHALEFYPLDVYLDLLIKFSPDCFRRSPKWFSLLINRIFNKPEICNLFVDKIKSIQKDVLRDILELTAIEYPHHKELCVRLMQDSENF